MTGQRHHPQPPSPQQESGLDGARQLLSAVSAVGDLDLRVAGHAQLAAIKLTEITFADPSQPLRILPPPPPSSSVRADLTQALAHLSTQPHQPRTRKDAARLARATREVQSALTQLGATPERTGHR
jgi:hypothetical protein